ncbi:hypothetical protein V8F33_006915 [Rhypophila sp. PSN 637]
MGLVDHVLRGNRTSYNVSFLIQTCPDVCGLVYGTGNPDISGVGGSGFLRFPRKTKLGMQNMKINDRGRARTCDPLRTD